MKEFDQDNSAVLDELRNRYSKEIFPRKFSIENYKRIVSAEKCAYCGITKKEIYELSNRQMIFKKNERGWNMEIERKYPNREYSDNNCVPACYWCNNAKTDEFDDKEFKLIGLAIGKALLARLKN